MYVGLTRADIQSFDFLIPGRASFSLRLNRLWRTVSFLCSL